MASIADANTPLDRFMMRLSPPLIEPFLKNRSPLRVRQPLDPFPNLTNGNDAQMETRFFDAVNPSDDLLAGDCRFL